MWAVHKEFDDIARVLIEKGAKINLKNLVGNSALLIATIRGVSFIDNFIKYKRKLNIPFQCRRFKRYDRITP